MRLVALSLLALPCALAAQNPPVTKDAPGGGSAATMALRNEWRSYARWILTAAQEWPEGEYGYKPIASVRSFGQLAAHVAGSQFAICAPALGEDRAADEANVERDATSKAAIVAALQRSNEYCERAYAIADAQAMGATQLFGRPSTKLHALALNMGHSAEHYGNVITYMRMKGMVPPSSRGQ